PSIPGPLHRPYSPASTTTQSMAINYHCKLAYLAYLAVGGHVGTRSSDRSSRRGHNSQDDSPQDEATFRHRHKGTYSERPLGLLLQLPTRKRETAVCSMTNVPNYLAHDFLSSFLSFSPLLPFSSFLATT